MPGAVTDRFLPSLCPFAHPVKVPSRLGPYRIDPRGPGTAHPPWDSHAMKSSKRSRKRGTFLSRAGLFARRLTSRVTGAVRRRAVLARMRRADIVLASPRTSRLSLTALLYRLVLRSRYVHSMLYIGKGRILHTTARHGVVVGRVPRKIYRSDRYAIFRVHHLDEETRGRVVREALERREMKLDLPGLVTNVPARLLGLHRPLLSLERNRVWCSKLIVRSFREAGIEIVPDDRAENVTSEDLSRNPRLERV
jgi:hypothetical protein